MTRITLLPRRQLGRTGLRVTPLCVGGAALGDVQIRHHGGEAIST
ncbi:hypothetical protein [Ktedonobacter sp. SOSP1-85]|nr:hypothetical protein [Ktedonobacter sp. SOSP1-85]